MIGKEEEIGGRIFPELNLAIMKAVVQPMGREPESLRHLRHGEESLHRTWMG